MTSGATPKIFSTPSIKISRLVASRVALVAQNRIRSTPLRRITPAYSAVAASVLSIASGANALFLSTPWPNRTTCISRCTSRKLFPSISAMSRRMEFVPQSTAATRMRLPSTNQEAQLVLHRRVDLLLGLLRESVQSESVNI